MKRLSLLLSFFVAGALSACGGGSTGGQTEADPLTPDRRADPSQPGQPDQPGLPGLPNLPGAVDESPAAAAVPPGALYTSGNRIYVADGQGSGTVFKGRGANVHDTRSCWACTYEAPNVAEVTRRIDTLVDDWGANFIRVVMEAETDDPQAEYSVSIQGDPGYTADIEEIVRYATGKGVYVLLSLWHDPSIDDLGRPTSATAQKWSTLAERFVDEPRVLFGIVNEPESNNDGADDALVWAAMNETLQAIRAVEDAHDAPHHVVVAQGTRAWSRYVEYYTTHPLPGGNVAYEVHAYNPASDFAELITGPAATIPVIIGEFGPVEGAMSLADAEALIDLAMAHDVPFLAWTFHHACAPSLLVDNVGGQCGVGMDLQPSTWGQRFKAKLALPW